MNEVSSFVFKKFRFFLVIKKKIDFDLSKYQICSVAGKKKVIFGNKNSDLYCDDKKWFVDNRKIRPVIYMF